MGAGDVYQVGIQHEAQGVQRVQAAHRDRGSLPLPDQDRRQTREGYYMTDIIKIAGLFMLTMFFLGLGYWIGYTERKYEDEQNHKTD
jgi:cbb3-type cytochrome oxidase subunit 3